MPIHGLGAATELKAAFRWAVRVMSQTDPRQLAYSPQRERQENEMDRLVLMGLAARAKFQHLYVEHRDPETRLELSYEAFETFHLCAKLLAGYPINLSGSEPTQKRDATIDFIYNWCLKVAGDRPKNFQQMYKSAGATMSAENIAGLIGSHVRALPGLSIQEHSHPGTYCVIEQLIVMPRLPFDIQVPF